MSSFIKFEKALRLMVGRTYLLVPNKLMSNKISTLVKKLKESEQ